jgi:hypothetical protein
LRCLRARWDGGALNRRAGCLQLPSGRGNRICVAPVTMVNDLGKDENDAFWPFGAAARPGGFTRARVGRGGWTWEDSCRLRPASRRIGGGMPWPRSFLRYPGYSSTWLTALSHYRQSAQYQGPVFSPKIRRALASRGSVCAKGFRSQWRHSRGSSDFSKQ